MTSIYTECKSDEIQFQFNSFIELLIAKYKFCEFSQPTVATKHCVRGGGGWGAQTNRSNDRMGEAEIEKTQRMNETT